MVVSSGRVEVFGAETPRQREILTPAALDFVAALQAKLGATRADVLARRIRRGADLSRGVLPRFPAETRSVRASEWWVRPAPADLEDRRVEITGPVDRKMMINALNSGASVFMADFEDALSPTWRNVVEGQANLVDAVDGTIEFRSPDGKEYRLGPTPATLVVRPRGWHLVERHVRIDGEPVSASLFDFGVYAFHNHAALRARGSGPYFYLPKLESHLEARLWKEAFVLAEDTLGLSRGTIRATVLIETILAAFEVEEILYELRDHVCGLNAGRWDYIFSIVKKFRDRPDFLLPDRAQVTMTVPFMRAYTRRLVAVCHARGAHAIGGMAAFIPNRRDADVTAAALAAVRADKDREAGDGFDGTWVAHPDLVPVAKEAFDRVLGTRPNQLSRIPEEGLRVTEADLLDVRVPGGRVTTKGLRTNVEVGTRYIAAWLSGTGAAAIHNLMEDAATAEISRSQVFQWIRHGARLEDGTVVSQEFVRALLREELSKIRLEVGDESYRLQRFDEAARVFLEVALQDPFVDFLTIPAYDLLEPMETPA